MTKVSREAAVSAAVDYLAAHGFQPTSMREFCEGVGLSNGSFYNRFRRWEALGGAVYRDLSFGLSKVLRQDFGSSKKSQAGRVNGLVERWVGWIEANQPQARLMFELEAAYWNDESTASEVRLARKNLETAVWDLLKVKPSMIDWSVVMGPFETACRNRLLFKRPSALSSHVDELATAINRNLTLKKSPKALSGERQKNERDQSVPPNIVT